MEKCKFKPIHKILFNEFYYYLLELIFAGYGSDHGPICYACAQQPDEKSCSRIEVCGRDEACYAAEITIATQTIIRTGCHNNIVSLYNIYILCKFKSFLT